MHVIRDEETSQIIYKNLPRELEGLITNFNAQERWDNFRAVLECSVALHAAISVESSGDNQSIMRASTMVLEEQKDLITAEEFNGRVAD